MHKIPKEPILNYWYQALASEHGIELACSDTDSIRSILYMVRKEAQDADLAQIKLAVSPFDPTRLWLIKKERANAEA